MQRADRHDVVAVLPAAGSGKRLGPLPCSKELFPIGFESDAHGAPRVRVVTEYLLDKFEAAGVATGVMVLREGKWDVPSYFARAQRALQLSYVVVGDTLGPPDSVDRAYAFVHDKRVVFGFPDILFGPRDVFDRLLTRLERTDADIVLGLYEVHDPSNMDPVECDAQGWVRAMYLKPAVTELRYAWLCAAWRPSFSAHLHRCVAEQRAAQPEARRERFAGIDARGDMPMGLVIQSAVHAGMRVACVPFPGERYLDIGTPEALVQAAAELR